MNVAAREAQTYASPSLPARFANLVRLPHTLFALPFAGLGAILATYPGSGAAIDWLTAVWIVVAFTAARFAAMGFNRIVDRRIDASNPRTQRRELPAGALTVGQAAAAVVVASAVFLGAAWLLNPLCGMLAPLALAWVFCYSFTKRFTALSHHVLGFALGIAPVGAYLAVTGAWSTPWTALVALAAAVTFWVAGFDVIYALQDIGFDRAQGLHSLASKLGARGALSAARIFHTLAVALFFGLWAFGLFPVSWIYLGGVGVAAFLLAYEHWVVRDAARGEIDLARIDRAFFHTNVAVGLSLFLFTLVDRLLLATPLLLVAPPQ